MHNMLISFLKCHKVIKKYIYINKIFLLQMFRIGNKDTVGILIGWYPLVKILYIYIAGKRLSSAGQINSRIME